jgi:hypothetical protein
MDQMRVRVRQFEWTLFVYAVRLKGLASLALLSDIYNKELLFAVASLCTRIASIFNENLFVKIMQGTGSAYQGAAHLMDKRFVLDLCTCFGLFNYFDARHLANDLTRGDAFRASRATLTQINTALYASLSEQFKVGKQHQLLDYSLSLLNLDIQVADAGGEMARVIRATLQEFVSNQSESKSSFERVHFILTSATFWHLFFLTAFSKDETSVGVQGPAQHVPDAVHKQQGEPRVDIHRLQAEHARQQACSRFANNSLCQSLSCCFRFT